MGTYNLSYEEIAGVFEDLEVALNCEGGFYEEEFILGAMEYVRRLRKEGTFIYTEKRKEIKKFKEVLANGD